MSEKPMTHPFVINNEEFQLTLQELRMLRIKLDAACIEADTIEYIYREKAGSNE
jgi:hypothetical protein